MILEYRLWGWKCAELALDRVRDTWNSFVFEQNKGMIRVKFGGKLDNFQAVNLYRLAQKSSPTGVY
jgi:hypothetical protein